MTRPPAENDPSKDTSKEQPSGERPGAAEAKLVQEFYQRHEDFFVSYASDASINVKPSPAGLGTFAIDLQEGTMFVHPGYFTEQGYSEAKAVNSTLHEIEHFRELRDLLAEPRGDQRWLAHNERLKANRRLKLLDNVWDDVRVDRSILSRAPAQQAVQESLYHENLWPETDMRMLPRHLQFAYGLFRETMLPDEPVTVVDEVRAELDRLRAVRSRSGVSLLDYASRPNLPPSLRIDLQKKYLEPVYEKLFQEDVRDEQQKQAAAGGQGQGAGKPQPGEAGEPPEKPAELTPAQAEQLFAAQYDEYFAKNPDAALPDKLVEEAVKEAQQHTAQQAGEHDAREQAYARAADVSVEDLREYQRFWAEVEQLRNLETDQPVIEELRQLFRRILTERTKRVPRSRLPVSEGELLARPAEAVAAIRAGLLEPEVWETTERQERPRELVGNFDVTLIPDRSGSMDEADAAGAVKKVEQRKAAMLVLEALTEFARDLDDGRASLSHDLAVQTEVRSFGGTQENQVLKELSPELSEKERVAVYKTLQTTPGQSTMDYLPLEDIERSLTAQDRAKLVRGELRKIIVVLSDGESQDPARVQRALAKLREAGVIVVGIGVTGAGLAAAETYAPDGRVASRAGDLASVLAEVLKQHIVDLNRPTR